MKRKTKYKHKFERLIFNNRWATPYWHRSGNWLVIGIDTQYFSPTEYEFKIGFFGFELRIFMIRILNDRH